MTTISRIQNEKLKLRNNLNDLLSSIRQMNIKSVTKANKEYQRQHPQGVWLCDDVWGIIVEFMLGTDKKFKPPYERWRPSLRMRQFFPGEVYHGIKDGCPVQMVVLRRERYSEQKAGHRIHYMLLKKQTNRYWEIEISSTEGRVRTAWVRQTNPLSFGWGEGLDTIDETIKNTRYNIEFKAQNMLCAWNDVCGAQLAYTHSAATTPAEQHRRNWLFNKAGHFKGNNRQIKMKLERDGSVKVGFVGNKILLGKSSGRGELKHKIYRWIKWSDELVRLQAKIRSRTTHPSMPLSWLNV